MRIGFFVCKWNIFYKKFNAFSKTKWADRVSSLNNLRINFTKNIFR